MSKLVELGAVTAATKQLACKGLTRDGKKSNACTSFWVYMKVTPDSTQPYDPSPIN